MLKKLSIADYIPLIIWIFFGLFSFRYGFEIWNGGNEWKTGDWLINYSDGFIRRGFFGSLMYWLSDFGVSLLWLTYGIQIAIYSAMFMLVSKLYKTSERSFFWLLILFSPAYLLFPFYDFHGGFRKEILVLTLFAYFSLLYARFSVSNAKIIWIMFFYLLAGLSHEITIFVLPFFIYLLWRCFETNQIEVKYAVYFSFGFIFISICLLFLSFLFKGSEYSASVICNSLVQRSLDPNICSGAISALKEDTSSSIQRVIEMFGPHSFSVIQVAFLAFVPTVFTSFWKKKLLVLLIVSIVFIAPLFVLAIDWGRWIYILAFMFYCLLLSENVSIRLSFQYSYLIVGLLYLTMWSIPHCCVGGGVGAGFVGTIFKYFYSV
jgi:hypothetical protein